MLMDYLLLWLTKRILHKHTGSFRILIGSLLGTAVTLFLYCYPICFAWMGAVRLLLACGMVLVTFSPVKGTELPYMVLTVYVLAFGLEGMLRFVLGYPGLKTHGIRMFMMLMGMLLFGGLFLGRVMDWIRHKLSLQDHIYDVQICVKGVTANGRGFLDSGNQLREPITGRNVVVVEEKFLLDNGIAVPQNACFVIPFRALGCDGGMLKGFLADEMIVQRETKKLSYQRVMLGVYEGKLCNRDAYQMLLHPAM